MVLAQGLSLDFSLDISKDSEGLTGPHTCALMVAYPGDRWQEASGPLRRLSVLTTDR